MPPLEVGVKPKASMTKNTKNEKTQAITPQTKRYAEGLALKQQTVENWIKTGEPGTKIAGEPGTSYRASRNGSAATTATPRPNATIWRWRTASSQPNWPICAS